MVINGTPNGNSTLLMMEDSTSNEKWHLQLEGTSGNLGFTETGVADDRFVLAAGGNVGIGTGSPSATLEVNGSALVDGALTASSFSGDGSALTNVGNAALGLCTISGFVTCNGASGPDPTHTFVYVRGASSLAYVGDHAASGYPYQLTLMQPGTYTVVARASNGAETTAQVTVSAGQTANVSIAPVNDPRRIPTNCGTLRKCTASFPNATAGCTGGKCTIARNPAIATITQCGAGANATCINTTTDANKAGQLRYAVCPTKPNSTPACVSSACTVTCNPAYPNLCGNNGCYTDLTNDPNNCGGCGRVCPGIGPELREWPRANRSCGLH